MKILFQLALVVLILFGATLFRQYLIDHAPEVPVRELAAFVPTVETVTVAPVSRTLFVDCQGTVSSPSRMDLSTEITGRVVRINPALEEGAFLKAGAELIAIDDADYTLAVEAASATIKAREASLALEQETAAVATADWRELHEGTPPPLVTHELQIAAARASLAGARVAERQAQLALSRSILSMPFDGRVIAKNVELGKRVNPAAPVVTLERSDDLEVRLTLGLDDLAFLDLDLAGAGAEKLEMVLTAELGGREHQWRARGARTAASLDARNPVVTLIATVERPKDSGLAALVPGLFVHARIRGREGVLTTPIPRSALQVDGTVLIVDAQDRLRRKRVEILKLTHSEALLAEPLASGQSVRVVTRAPSIALEGMQVQVLAAAEEAPNR